MPEAIKEIAINTGGGDAPARNGFFHRALCATRGMGREIEAGD